MTTMNQSQATTERLIRNISDTACWAAIYRARETERPDSLFRDPFARRLAGRRGEQIADTIPYGNKNTWSWVTRTYLFDQFVMEQVAQGVDMRFSPTRKRFWPAKSRCAPWSGSAWICRILAAVASCSDDWHNERSAC